MTDEADVRAKAMAWLDERPSPQVDYAWLAGFEYAGSRIPLMDRQRGIRKPAGFQAALAIRTTYTAPRQRPPYDDSIGPDGFQRYKYRGSDPGHHENIALRRAFELRLPLIWFVGTAPGLYEAIYPVWVVDDQPELLEFTLALDEAQRAMTGRVQDEATRRYAERLTRARLHQRVFRSQVLDAYGGRCSICRIGHAELLDAAHIIPDGRPQGDPVVPNGLALCKIHHAAFDAEILAVRPDLTLHVRSDILEEVDGPMLRHGIQEVHDRSLEIVPATRSARPDPARLAVRYREFLAVG